MQEIYKKALASYLEMLEIHIDTKTKDATFHEKTNEFYDVLFDVAHKIGERYVDLG
jgi:DNA-binding ferritin-like protein